MKKAFAVFLALFFVLNLSTQGQALPKYELSGVIKDQNAAVVPGMRLKIKGNGFDSGALTDINGVFKIQLPDGDFELTADALAVDKFRAFIKIDNTALNPNYLEFTINSDAMVCSGNRGGQSPKIISSVEPVYPAAAKAVRAMGEVVVVVKIAQDGKVATAKAVSGHPLLRRASEVAAEKFVFEPSEATAERETAITFVFLPEQDIKKNLNRYKCSYRIIIASEASIIETTESG